MVPHGSVSSNHHMHSPEIKQFEKELYFTASDVAESLDSEDWDLIIEGKLERTATDPAGIEVTIHDTVFNARRRSARLWHRRRRCPPRRHPSDSGDRFERAVRPARKTSAPSLAKDRATAPPIDPPAPYITATLASSNTTIPSSTLWRTPVTPRSFVGWSGSSRPLRSRRWFRRLSSVFAFSCSFVHDAESEMRDIG